VDANRRALGVSLAWLALAGCGAAPPDVAEAGNPLDEHPQPWARRAEPVLSAYTTGQDWSKVVVYTPFVMHRDGKFKMWYLGTSTGSRSTDMALGYAESDDGFAWREYDDNPILAGDDIPWGPNFQTPFVLFDEEEQIYKMWFVSVVHIERGPNGKMTEMTQSLGYATSPDGLRWNVHPEPIYESGRSPSVIKEGPNRYRMWMGSRPSRKHPAGELARNFYEFTSSDGVNWERLDPPVLRPSGKATTIVYPFVLKENDEYDMWYGGHIEGGTFEIFHATSADGTNWETDHENTAFPSTKDKDRFDGRYTSTPCVLSLPDRYLLYYSARDWRNEYIDNQARERTDEDGIYAHIGVAVMEK
jgi:hypothetical protein